MQNELDLVRKFHDKFKILISKNPSLIPRDRYQNRYKLMKDEVEEYFEGARNEDLENIAKELADILYAVYGTVLEHGLQDKIADIFTEVHRSNMSKDYHEYKPIKGTGYFKANMKKYL